MTIMAALNAVSSIVGGAQSAAANREAKRIAEAKERQRQAENQAWYDRRYNEDPLQRSSAQRILTKMAEAIKERNRAAQGRQAVMGGTEESVAATKAANAKAMADAASAIAAANDARKDKIEDKYLNQKYASEDRLAESQEKYEQNRANNIAQAVQGVGNAAGSIIASGVDGKGGGSGYSAKEYFKDKPTLDGLQDAAEAMKPDNANLWDKIDKKMAKGTIYNQ